MKQLAELHNKKLYLKPIMEKSILTGWIGFFFNDKNQPYRPSEKSAQEQAEQVKREREAEYKAKLEEENKPPPDKEAVRQNEGYQGIQEYLKKRKLKK